MKLTVVIVNYNVCYYLEQCLLSVQKALEGIEGEIYVVDNHSKDGSVAYLSACFPAVHFIDSNHNLGFARANNIAIRQSCGEYVLLLNPDTIVGEHTLSDVLQFMDAHPQAGGAGVMMHNTDGSRANESRRAIPTPMVSFRKMLGFSSRYYMSHLPWDKPGRIEVISGAFCMLRRRALDQIGLLDEDFFMYGEDIDLSYRLLKGGFENWYIPSPILHYKGESTEKSSFRYIHVFYEAMLIFFRKHYGNLNFLFTLPVRIAIYFRAFIALIQMQTRLLRKSLGFVSRQSNQPEYVFVGSESMLDACRQLARHKGLAATYYNNKELASAVAGQTDGRLRIVVFDAASFSYEEMMHQLPDHHFIGTYHIHTNTIITPWEIVR